MNIAIIRHRVLAIAIAVLATTTTTACLRSAESGARPSDRATGHAEQPRERPQGIGVCKVAVAAPTPRPRPPERCDDATAKHESAWLVAPSTTRDLVGDRAD